jgi:HAD superfamily hydrolase (TIGR01493 family)
MVEISPRCLVLDAMGVLFDSADDVAELLIPFIREMGGERGARAIESAYVEASLGHIDADSFWTRVGLMADVEPGYLAKHRLQPGALDFLKGAHLAAVPVWCLSNDIGRWSKHLRTSLGIEPFLAGAVISSDVGVRKPDPKIYERVLAETGCRPREILFVDDRMGNVAAAAALGIRAEHFAADYGYAQLAADLFRVDDETN